MKGKEPSNRRGRRRLGAGTIGNPCEKIFLLLAMSLCIVVLQLQGCAPYSQKEITQLWNEVAREYPGHHKMPQIITVHDGSVGGFYIIASNTVVIDKYAAEVVWKHEFRHACGDSLGEVACRVGKAPILTSVPRCADDLEIPKVANYGY